MTINNQKLRGVLVSRNRVSTDECKLNVVCSVVRCEKINQTAGPKPAKLEHLVAVSKVYDKNTSQQKSK